MSKKFDELEIVKEGKPKKTYMFEANAEYSGHTFHKFQKKTQTKEGPKWQTLTVSPEDFPDFAEWVLYVLEEMNESAAGSFGNDTPF